LLRLDQACSAIGETLAIADRSAIQQATQPSALASLLAAGTSPPLRLALTVNGVLATC
jgi:hypothetical protein